MRAKRVEGSGADDVSRHWSPREQKKEFFDRIEGYATELADKLTRGDPEDLKRLLEFFSSKCTRWSYLNLLGLMLQRPGIQRPVTIGEARNFGHYKRRDVTPATILVPHVVGDDPRKSPTRAIPAPAPAPDPLASIKWEDNPLHKGCVELYPDGLVLQVWEGPNPIWNWCKKSFPEGSVLESGQTCSMAQAQRGALESLSEQERDLFKNRFLREMERDITDSGPAVKKEEEQPSPRKRLFFKTVACVLDLGKDTVGPKLSQGEKNGDPDRVAKVLGAGKAYAESLGLTIVEEYPGLPGNAPAAVSSNRQLFLATYVSETAQAGNLLHELTHWLLHLKPLEAVPGGVSGGRKLEGPQTPKQFKELQAEACAYVTAKSLGIPREFSVSYLQGFSITKKDLMDNLKIIAATSRTIVQGITEFLQEDQRQDIARNQTLQETQPADSVQSADRGFDSPDEDELWRELEEEYQNQADPDPEVRPAQVIVRKL